MAAYTKEDHQYLRLLPGDAGYFLWQNAILTFLDDIVQKVTRIYADGQDNKDQYVQDIYTSFPVDVVRGL